MLNKRVAVPKMITRFLSICIDFILFGVIFFILNSFVFMNVFSADEETHLVAGAQIYSGVLVLDDNQEYYNQVNSNRFEDYQEIVENYYITDKYFGSEFYLEHGGTRSKMTIEEYNEQILQLGTEYTYFEYQYDENDNIDYSKIGIIKQDYYVDNDRNNQLNDSARADLLTFYSRHYRTIFEDLYNDEFYSSWREVIVWKGQLQAFCSLMSSYIVIFLIPPLTNKWGFTLGRLCLKIGLINRHGIYSKRYYFLIRNIPMLILISSILLGTGDLLILGPIYGAYFLFNWLATLMNKDNASFLDLISVTRVCLIKESTIYDDIDDIEDDESLYQKGNINDEEVEKYQ